MVHVFEESNRLSDKIAIYDITEQICTIFAKLT